MLGSVRIVSGMFTSSELFYFYMLVEAFADKYVLDYLVERLVG